jgi:hypothetical protein
MKHLFWIIIILISIVFDLYLIKTSTTTLGALFWIAWLAFNGYVLEREIKAWENNG